jgi:hypothetical protein
MTFIDNATMMCPAEWRCFKCKMSIYGERKVLGG